MTESSVREISLDCAIAIADVYRFRGVLRITRSEARIANSSWKWSAAQMGLFASLYSTTIAGSTFSSDSVLRRCPCTYLLGIVGRVLHEPCTSCKQHPFAQLKHTMHKMHHVRNNLDSAGITVRHVIDFLQRLPLRFSMGTTVFWICLVYFKCRRHHIIYAKVQGVPQE